MINTLKMLLKSYSLASKINFISVGKEGKTDVTAYPTRPP